MENGAHVAKTPICFLHFVADRLILLKSESKLVHNNRIPRKSLQVENSRKSEKCKGNNTRVLHDSKCKGDNTCVLRDSSTQI